MPGILRKIRLQIRRWAAGKAGAPWPRWTAAERETDTPINQALAEEQETLRTKAINEAANNPFVEGCIGTHQEDWIGPNGPTLRVFSDKNPEYCEKLEEAWRKWFRSPCVDRRMSGASLLKLWVRKLWNCGEFLAQRVTRDVRDGVTLRLKPIHPRRLVSPMGTVDDHVFMGIRVDDDNVPVVYFIAPPPERWATILPTDCDEVPAADIIHEFIVIEEDQLRGAPFQSPSVDSVTDMREYDEHVTEAADAAAKMTVVWSATGPDVDTLELNGTSTAAVARGSHSCGPPGWNPMQIQPNQPGAKWAEHRREKQAEIGRPVGMPLLIVRQDAANHNYSSARFDSLGYWDRVRGFQMWMGGSVENRGILYDLVDEIAREVAAVIGPPPEDVRYEFLWPKQPQIDDEKAAKAAEVRLRNKTSTLTDELAAQGKTLKEHVGMLVKEKKLFETEGLEYPAFGETGTQAGNDDDDEDPWDKEDKKETEENEESEDDV